MTIQNPHDKLFKATFGDVIVAKDFLLHYLPENLLKAVDMASLEPQKDSFISEALKEQHSDLLFKANFSEEEGYFYFLFEHKSYPSRGIVLQLQQYMLNIWNAKTKKERNWGLPIIIPMVIYHGKEKWHVPRRLREMLKGYDQLTEDLKMYIPDFEYLFYDLSHQTGIEAKLDAQIKIYRALAAEIAQTSNMDMILKTIFKVITLTAEIKDREKADEYFRTVMNYILSVVKHLKETHLTQIHYQLEKVYPEGSETFMTLADILREEGEEKGLRKGKAVGKAEAQVSMAKKLISRGYPTEDIRDLTDLKEEEITKLKKQMLQ